MTSPTVLRLPIKLIGGLSQALALVALVMVFVLIGATVYEVVARHVFNAPTIWANDVSYMSNAALYLLAAAVTLKLGGHVRIDIFSIRLSPRVQDFIGAAAFLLLFGPGLALVSNVAVDKVISAIASGERETMSAWEPAVWPYYLAIALGLVSLTLQSFAEGLKHLGWLFTGRPAGKR